MKYSLICIVILSVKLLSAQSISNHSFENWIEHQQFGAGFEVIDWTVSYRISNVGPAINRNNYGQDGKFGVTMRVTADFQTKTPLTATLAYGKLQFQNNNFETPNLGTGGLPYTSRPKTFSGYQWFYIPQGLSDSAFVYVLLKRYNSSTQQSDTIAYAKKAFSPQHTFNQELSYFELPLNYQSEQVPDTACIVFLVKATTTSSDSTGALFLDNIAFDRVLGINIPSEKIDLVAYPNPSIDGKFNIYVSDNQITNYKFDLYDINGQRIEIDKPIKNASELDLSKLARGVYTLRVTGNKHSNSTLLMKH